MSSKQFVEAQRRHQRGDIQGALRVYKTIITSDPGDGRARLYFALALNQVGNLEAASLEAARAFEDIASPTFADYSTLGLIHKGVGRLADSIDAFERGLELSPGHPGLLSNLATTFLGTGQLDRAEHLFRELIEKLPEDPAPALNLARIFMRTGRMEEAHEFLQLARRQDPSHPDYLSLQAGLLISDTNYADAFKYLTQLIEKVPAHRDGWRLLRIIESSDADQRVLTRMLDRLATLKVDSARVLSSAVAIARHNLLWENLPKLESQLNEALLNQSDIFFDSSSVFDLLSTNVSQEAHLVAAKQAWKGITALVPPPSTLNPISSGSKIRVAFLSSDLREHAIGHLIVGLMEVLPKEKIEWFAYSNSGDDGGPNRQRFRQAFDRFTSVSGLSDLQLAEVIRDDEVDILIDLNGMTADTRVLTMAYRPAPIQIQWLGMPGTIGADKSIDYVIVDPWTVDESNSQGFAEALLMLPRSYQPNDHAAPDLSRCDSRSAAGLPEDGTIFGCFNQYYKISPDTFDLWLQILERVPGSYFWLLEPKSDVLKERLLQSAGNRGVEPSRFIFARQKPHLDHIARLQWMDLVLDTWPYNAHTTCSDALRAGVPVLTSPGSTFASRVAAGILETSGLGDWIAGTAEEYVEMAVKFGRQSRASIVGEKARIKEAYWSGGMVDNRALAKQLEALFVGLHAHHQNGGAVRSFGLSRDLSLKPISYGRDDNSTETTSGAVKFNRNSSQQRTNVVQIVEGAASGAHHPEWLSNIKKGGPQARLHNLGVFKNSVLRYDGLPLAVDVGAADFNSAIGHEALAAAGLIRTLGFEPDPASFGKLKATANVEYLETALGDGATHKLSLCAAPGMNSILEPRNEWLALFPMFSVWAAVNDQISVQTARLDEIRQADDARFMKIDVQGAERMILEHGQNVISKLSLLQIEASPSPLYHGEASLWEIGEWLSRRGFVLHCFSDLNKRRLKPFGKDDAPFAPGNQLFQVDAVFMPDPLKWADLDDDRLLSLAFFAHAIYRSHDVAMLAMRKLDERDDNGRVRRYSQYLEAAGLDA